jgi:GNAT superfamily N-acetyltransferase
MAPAKRVKTRPIVLRGPRRGDLPRIGKLFSELGGRPLTTDATANRLRLVAEDPDQAVVVASADGEVVGVLGFRIRHNLEEVSHYGEVSLLIVAEEWRQHGIGRLLMKRAEALARKRRCVGLWLVTGFGREAEAHAFYRRLGFEENGVRMVRPFADRTIAKSTRASARTRA